MQSFRNLTFIVAAGATTLAAMGLPVSLSGPLPAHTGGFGEPSCHACHFDYPLNEPGATVQLDSLPVVFEPQRSYTLTLRVRHTELKRAGFQLTARFADGSPAGSFIINDTTLLRVQRSKSIDYLSHTTKGTDQVFGDTARWSFAWVAPTIAKPIVFNVAVNVADKDASQFGDRIFTKVFSASGQAVKK